MSDAGVNLSSMGVSCVVGAAMSIDPISAGMMHDGEPPGVDDDVQWRMR